MLTAAAKSTFAAILAAFGGISDVESTSAQDIECLAQNVWFETRGSAFADKLAVANVVMNRVDALNHPGSVCEVIFQPKQFSWTHDGLSDKVVIKNAIDRDAWTDSVIAAISAYNSALPDISFGSTFFHAGYVQPSWAEGFDRRVAYGGHIFYGQTPSLPKPVQRPKQGQMQADDPEWNVFAISHPAH